MPEKKTLERAAERKRRGRAKTTQAGEFVREEIHHVRQGKHGARSAKQAIAIGLSKARRAGIKLPASRSASAETRKAERDSQIGKKRSRRPARRRSRASERALGREGHAAASKRALARQARSSAKKRGATARSQAAKKASRTKGARDARLRRARPHGRERAENPGVDHDRRASRGRPEPCERCRSPAMVAGRHPPDRPRASQGRVARSVRP